MKKVLILSFFPAFQPPRSGGELRLSQMAHRLAERFEVQLISTTFPEAQREVIRHGPRFTETRLPKARRYLHWHRLLARTAKFEECSGLVCGLSCAWHRDLRREVEEARRDADIVIHESPFLYPLASRPAHRRQLLVYNSYNVESRLARDMFGSGPAGKWATSRVRSLEGSLLKNADLIFACSEEDEEGFCADYKADRSKIHLVPNGIDPESCAIDRSPENIRDARARLNIPEGKKLGVFLGSFHPPNTEAVHFLATRVAPAFGDMIFAVAGKVCAAFANATVPPNVRLMGLVDEATRQDLFATADVALNPMLVGSGTNLKMLEYMGAGIPVVTTPHGARGLRLVHLRHAALAEPDRYVRVLAEVLGNESVRRHLGSEGRAHIMANFTADRIGDRVAELLELKTSRRVLLLNDYPIAPADAGGKIRINAVAKALGANGRQVSIVTLHGERSPRRLAVSPNVEELNIPRPKLLRRIDAFIAWHLGCSADDSTALLFTRLLCSDFVRAVKREGRFADAVLFSHCYLEPLRKVLPGNPAIFYDSHNEESELKRSLYKRGLIAGMLVRRVRNAERSLARVARRIFCVSEENRAALEALFPGSAAKADVVPNGVACTSGGPMPLARRAEMRATVGLGREFTAAFLGSGHPPNALAVRRIVEDIAPRTPEVTFLIIGSVCAWFVGESIPSNVVLMGAVRNDVKGFLLRTSDLALNPMEVGSGTSLKLFDYLAAGLPVLTTPLGSRGLDEDVDGAVMRVPIEEFQATLARLAADPGSMEASRGPAVEFAREMFDWPVVLKPMVNLLAGARRDTPTPAPIPAGAKEPAASPAAP